QELFQALRSLCRDYEKLLALFERLHDSYEPGHLLETSRNNHLQYAYSRKKNGHRVQTTLSPSTPDGTRQISQLREKKVVTHGQRVLRKNINTIQNALKRLTPYEPEKYAGSFIHLDCLALPDRDFLPGQLNTAKWIRDTLAGNYKTNTYPKEKPQETKSGHIVRSKSEMLWDDILFDLEQLFRYDSAIRLKSGRVIYADFVVLHPQENRLVIIEHFGKLSKPQYAMDALKRLKDYADSGYAIGRDLFYTMETLDQPLTRPQVLATLQQIGIPA
ncbi:MAG: hypothetical protein II456_03860, partial [Firmicutes bacterium]|nr:hypothetical protein [Bacillota bacterium]